MAKYTACVFIGCWLAATAAAALLSIYHFGSGSYSWVLDGNIVGELPKAMLGYLFIFGVSSSVIIAPIFLLVFSFFVWLINGKGLVNQALLILGSGMYSLAWLLWADLNAPETHGYGIVVGLFVILLPATFLNVLVFGPILYKNSKTKNRK